MKSKVFSITPEESLIARRDPFYEIIKNKIPAYAEIVVNLFDHCNMRCVFCPQDHNDMTGASYEEVMSKIEPIANYINNNPSAEFHLHMMGGELFQDKFIQLGFLEIYREFMDRLREKCSTNKVLRFYFITNLVFTMTGDVLDFLIGNRLKMAVSYDPTGRFNKEQLVLFKENIEIFKPYIRVISSTITRSSIEKMQEGDEYFDYLYQNFTCDWDHLLPGSDLLKPMMPAESDLLSFYKLLIDKYPECLNITTFTESPEQRDNSVSTMPCTRGNSFTIFSDNSIPKGCSGAVILKNKNTKDIASADVVHRFLDEHECFNCEYYQRCSFTCFVHHDYKELVRDVKGCVFKESFKYAEQKREEQK